MGVKTLTELCISVCVKNIKDITDIGSTPYELVRSFLMRIDSAAQLRQLEENSPHLREDDAECWERLIQRDYRILADQYGYVPRDPRKWHKIYTKYAKIDAQRKLEAEEKLKNAMAGIKQKKDSNTSAVVNFDKAKLPRPPRDMRTVGRKEALGRRGGSNDTGELRFTSGTRTKTNNAKSAMRKIKRLGNDDRDRARLATPGGALVVRANQIKRAPQGMVNETMIKGLPSTKIIPPAMKRKAEDDMADKEMKAREDRLKRLKGTAANIIDDSDSDEDEGDYDDDQRVFGGREGRSHQHKRLTEHDLEDIFDGDDGEEPEEDVKPARMASRPARPGRSGILSGPLAGAKTRPTTTIKKTPSSATPSRHMGHAPPPAAPKSSPLTSPPLRPATSPPLKPTNAPQSGSPSSLKPLPPKRRPPPNIFMPKKQQPRRP